MRINIRGTLDFLNNVEYDYERSDYFNDQEYRYINENVRVMKLLYEEYLVYWRSGKGNCFSKDFYHYKKMKYEEILKEYGTEYDDFISMLEDANIYYFETIKEPSYYQMVTEKITILTKDYESLLASLSLTDKEFNELKEKYNIHVYVKHT